MSPVSRCGIRSAAGAARWLGRRWRVAARRPAARCAGAAPAPAGRSPPRRRVAAGAAAGGRRRAAAAGAAAPPRIGLALGGGAARGFAHIGVIQVLEENGIRPTWWSAPRPAAWWRRCTRRASSGKRAARRSPTRMDETAFTDWSFPGRGLIRGEALARYVRDADRRPRRSSRCGCRWASSPPTSTAARRSCSGAATPAPRCARPARCRRCSSR